MGNGAGDPFDEGSSKEAAGPSLVLPGVGAAVGCRRTRQALPRLGRPRVISPDGAPMRVLLHTPVGRTEEVAGLAAATRTVAPEVHAAIHHRIGRAAAVGARPAAAAPGGEGDRRDRNHLERAREHAPPLLAPILSAQNSPWTNCLRDIRVWFAQPFIVGCTSDGGFEGLRLRDHRGGGRRPGSHSALAAASSARKVGLVSRRAKSASPRARLAVPSPA